MLFCACLCCGLHTWPNLHQTLLHRLHSSLTEMSCCMQGPRACRRGRCYAVQGHTRRSSLVVWTTVTWSGLADQSAGTSLRPFSRTCRGLSAGVASIRALAQCPSSPLTMRLWNGRADIVACGEIDSRMVAISNAMPGATAVGQRHANHAATSGMAVGLLGRFPCSGRSFHGRQARHVGAETVSPTDRDVGATWPRGGHCAGCVLRRQRWRLKSSLCDKAGR